jgi:outer membrane protein assembly factor BamB
MVFTPWLAQTGVVYAASAKGLVEGYEFATGKRVLELKTGKPLSGAIGGDEQGFYLGTSKGEVLAYDFSGQLRWSVRVGSEVLVPPKTALGAVLVRVNDGSVVALDAKVGISAFSAIADLA